MGNINIVNNLMCGNGPNRICAGDDGGPVFCNNRVFGLIGLTDIHYCSNSVSGRHTPYINIANYHDWIVAQINTDNDGDSAQKQFINSFLIISVTALLKFVT